MRALTHGFGIETDFRDLNCQLVVSHDMPLSDAMSADEFAALYRSTSIEAPFALNIKSDGLQCLMNQFIQDAGFQTCFVFDMAMPDMLAYISLGIPAYTRLSEYEAIPSLLSACKGVWLDAFESTWYDFFDINTVLDQDKGVAIVSPELHGRPHLEFWQWLKVNRLHEHS